MRSKSQLFLRYALLAAYAGISFLGEGLHLLTPDDGHHHAGIYVVASGEDHAYHVSHDRNHRDNSARAIVKSNEHGVHSHFCGVCEFLFQAISQPPAPAPQIECQPLIAAAPALQQSIYTPTSLGCHAPRGPPSFCA